MIYRAMDANVSCEMCSPREFVTLMMTAPPRIEGPAVYFSVASTALTAFRLPVNATESN